MEFLPAPQARSNAFLASNAVVVVLETHWDSRGSRMLPLDSVDPIYSYPQYSRFSEILLLPFEKFFN